MFFSVMTKNINWETLINNLVTFKMWDGVKNAKILIWGFIEKSDF